MAIARCLLIMLSLSIGLLVVDDAASAAPTAIVGDFWKLVKRVEPTGTATSETVEERLAGLRLQVRCTLYTHGDYDACNDCVHLVTQAYHANTAARVFQYGAACSADLSVDISAGYTNYPLAWASWPLQFFFY